MLKAKNSASAREAARPMPESPFERELEIRNTLRRLESDRHRLSRLGLHHPAESRRQELRYWQFLEVVFRLEPLPRHRRSTREGMDR